MKKENLSDSERFNAASGYFYPVIPAQAGIQEFAAQAGIQEFAAQAGIQEFAAQAGIQEFEERTGSRLSPGRRLCAYINACAEK